MLVGGCLGSLSFCEGRWAGLKHASTFAVHGPFTNAPYGMVVPFVP